CAAHRTGCESPAVTLSCTLSWHERVTSFLPIAHLPATRRREHSFARTSTPPPHKGVHMPKLYARRRLSILAALTGVIASAALFDSPSASAALPTPVSAATARGYLAQLTVATENRTGYKRDLFPTWITISGTCNTREWILKRDGSNVVTDSAC